MNTLYIIFLLFYLLVFFIVIKNTNIKYSLIFSFINIPLCIYLIFYIRQTYVDTVWQDGFLNIPLLQDISLGNFNISDLIKPAAEHMLLGYKLIFIANAFTLNLDMRLEPFLFMASSCLISLIIFLKFHGYAVRNNLSSAEFAGLYLPLAFLSYSLTAAPGMLMSTQFALSIPLVLLIAILFEDLLQEKKCNLLGLFLLIILYYSTFSGCYFIGFEIGILMQTFVFRFFTKKPLNYRSKLIISFTLILSLTYLLLVLGLQIIPKSSSIPSGIGGLIGRPVDTFLTYFGGIGSSLFDQHTMDGDISILLYFGMMFFVISLAILYIYFERKIYNITSLPIFCLFYSIGIMTAIRAGRSTNRNWEWITNEWYSFHYRLYAIGIIWICLLIIISYKKSELFENLIIKKISKKSFIFAIVTIVFVLSCHIFSNYFQWVRGPHVKNWLQEKQMALLFPYIGRQDVILWEKDDVDSARRYLLENRLSSFSARTLNEEVFRNNVNGAIRFNDWYGDDWLGRKSALMFMSGDKKKIQISITVPKFVPDSNIKIILNDEIVFFEKVSSGVAKNILGSRILGLNTLVITSDQGVSPAIIGINSDLRVLSIFFQSSITNLQ